MGTSATPGKQIASANSEQEGAIEVRNLVKRYPKAVVNAVDNISFTVGRGEIFGLLGPNGAGKTTTIGTLVKPEQIGLMFSLIFTPLIFTGCTYYPWGALDSIRWFQIITLFNPLTYAAEGLRFAMVPSFYGHALSTLAMPWIILGLSVTIVVFCIFGIRTFRRRVVM